MGCHCLLWTRALELSKGQQVNIYTDSKYTYLTLHAHAAQFKTAIGEAIKHCKEIERLLTAVHCPKEVTHWREAGIGVKQPREISWSIPKPEKWCFMNFLSYKRP